MDVAGSLWVCGVGRGSLVATPFRTALADPHWLVLMEGHGVGKSCMSALRCDCGVAHTMPHATMLTEL